MVLDTVDRVQTVGAAQVAQTVGAAQWVQTGWVRLATAARVGTALVAVLCCAAALAPAGARAEETVQITEAGFSPDALGVPTNAFGRATIGSTTGIVPSPIEHVTVYGPAGVTLNLEGTGTCTEAILLNVGPRGCPADSRAGFGGGEGIYELAKEIVKEPFTLDFFLGDNRPGHVTMLIYLNATKPVSFQTVFTAITIHGPRPYGLGFSLNVPLIKVLPEASDASATSSFLTLGAKNAAYYKTIHGHRKLLHVKGIILPKSCPHGGWPVASVFKFQDGSVVMAKRSIRCPRK